MELSAIIQIILYAVFVLLLSINTFFLVRMIGKQKGLIGDQDKIIKNQKEHLEFINSLMESLKKSYEERVEMVKVKSDEERKVMKKELQVKRKELEDKTQTLGKAKQTTSNMIKDIMQLIFLTYRISLFTGAPPIIETYIKEMKSSKFAKEEALESFRKAGEETKQWGTRELLDTLLRMPKLFEKKE